MRFIKIKNSKKDKKKYVFCYGELQNLSERINVDFIRDSKFYTVHINDLQLTEYFPGKLERMKAYCTNAEILSSLLSLVNIKTKID